MRFPGTIVMVTGGAGSLGRAVARAFAAEGARLALPVRSDVQMGQLSSELRLPPDRVHVGLADLGEEEAVRAFVDHVQKTFGDVEILIHCAGGYAGGTMVEDVPLNEWEDLMAKNLRSAFLVCKAVLPGMRRAGSGRIITVAAAAAIAPGARRGPYQVSKRGVITLTETIAEETRGTGITANVIAPSIILTEANRRSMPDADTSRWVAPEDIAACALFLCSKGGGSISGNTVRM